MRFRQDYEGDIGRIRRQQYFIEELLKQLVSFDSLFKLPMIIKSFSSIVQTDLNYSELISLFSKFKDPILNSRIQKTTVPGAFSVVGGAHYWKADIAQLDVVVDEVLLGFKQTSRLSQEIKKSRRTYSMENQLGQQ